MSAIKPGGLAIVVHARNAPQHAGKIVQCVRKLVIGSDLGWVIEPTLPNPNGDPFWWAKAECLRPIDNPGDDARDQSLDWLPVPSKEGMPV